MNSKHDCLAKQIDALQFMSLQLINCQFYKEKEEFFIAKKPIKLVNNILRGKNLSNKGGLIKHFSHFF